MFFRLVKNLYGRDLRAMLHIFVMQSISFSGTGELFGWSDLTEMYKNKAAQVKYIRANTRKMFSPMGGDTLYEDMQYELKETRREKQERDDLAMEAIRLFKRQKAEETNKEKQQRKIEDWLEFF